MASKSSNIRSIQEFIHTKSIEIANSPFISSNKGEELSASEIAQMLEKTFNDFLISPEEAEITKLEKKSQKLKQTIQTRENEIVKMKQKFRQEYRDVTNETGNLQAEFQSIQESLKTFDLHIDKRVEQQKDQRRKKEFQMEQMLNLLDESQAMEKSISSSMQELKDFIQYFHQGHDKMISQANKIWNSKLKSVIGKFKVNKDAMMNAIQNNLQTRIIAEKATQNNLKSIASSVIESFQNVDPNNKIDINPEIFEAHTSDMILYLDSALRKVEINARQKIFDQLHDVFPDFVANDKDPESALSVFIDTSVQKKEEEYNKLLMHRQEKENQLNEQLQKALEKIKALQESVSSFGGDDNIEDINVDGWETNRKILDEKIDKLKQFKSESSSMHSELIDSPYH
ncbi:hypothetical protein TVAG_426720 [Trichomonas vaginalis G3]|uniref:Uncharacterized protein n=1 Tax=Trichomonas vaginalis (strain ATCC PRA-98 / G3) TaxID=412133 RepID=A2DYT8_TRIV3|nr:hypothetical protein TVAGG3_0538620 [Trichomonas vaginalis G3]EAY14478.1 hypothetical protein TVAG_426720 [Trichomonas vaginalis G3]KAI5519670.1 hypothetical protein TVAGG3_0538620 [Trichomonas vaginalis G3]|eukprot:XP_001326701.1 hypothetical protein [Trichomonas vaginalis G3]